MSITSLVSSHSFRALFIIPSQGNRLNTRCFHLAQAAFIRFNLEILSSGIRGLDASFATAFWATWNQCTPRHPFQIMDPAALNRTRFQLFLSVLTTTPSPARLVAQDHQTVLDDAAQQLEPKSPYSQGTRSGISASVYRGTWSHAVTTLLAQCPRLQRLGRLNCARVPLAATDATFCGKSYINNNDLVMPESTFATHSNSGLL